MAKRFTDSGKWKKKFIRSLDTPYKLLWLYLLDECDHAGIWEVEIDIASIRTGEKFDLDKAREQFRKHIVEFDNGEKWFIPSFIIYQYGELNPANRVHESVILRLKKYKLEGAFKDLTRTLQGAKDKDKDKEKDKEYINEAGKIIDYLNAKTGKKFEHIDTHINLIVARLKDNRTTEQCRMVIDNKVFQWKDKEDSDVWLRPATLFRKSNFDNYVIEKPMGASTATRYY